jgi:hypothetical protein
MGSRTSKAIELVQRVVSVAVGRRGAIERVREARPVLAERAVVRVLHVTSAMAHQLARAPFPAATSTQRVALGAMAEQLRAATSAILTSEASSDRETVEGALAEAVRETLALVDVALHKDRELAHGDMSIKVVETRQVAELAEGESRDA